MGWDIFCQEIPFVKAVISFAIGLVKLDGIKVAYIQQGTYIHERISDVTKRRPITVPHRPTHFIIPIVRT